MSEPAFDLFPETAPAGPPLKVELGRIENPDVVIEHRGQLEVYRERTRVDWQKRKVGSYRPEHIRKYQAQVHEAARQAMGERPPFDSPIEILISVEFPVPSSWPKYRIAAALRGEVWPITKRKDWDNLAKAAVDACTQVVWYDDAQIVEAHVRKIYSATPMLRIEVRRLPTCP